MQESQFRIPKLPFTLKPRTIVLIIIAIVALVIVGGSFFVVDQTQEAVVLRLGKFNRTLGPGLHWKMPLGLEKNYNVPTQVIQNMSFGFRTESAGVNTVYSKLDYSEESTMLTGDLNIVDVQWTIQYRITDARAWLFHVDNQQKTVRDISQSVINMLVGDRAILEVMGEQRSTIEFQGQEEMNKIFNSYGLGLTVTTVKLRNIVPPSGAVKDAFEDVNRATQDMNRLINEGKEAFNKEIPKARGEAEQIIEQAKGYASERVNRSTGDVARFKDVLTQYNAEPDTTRTRLYYEMVESVFQNKTGEDLIDKNFTNFIPLMNLENKKPATPTAAVQGGN
ncbi:MAG TPA: FtsH protease activity modulator HflK [Spirochaetia bacterium]|nr:FtsH protease activity modulator HflK [Spirochaetia bacterium]